jgi:hypothetical protein
MKHCLAYLMANFGFTRANGLYVFLIKNDAVRASGKVKNAPLCGGNTFEGTQYETSRENATAGSMGMGPPRTLWSILHQNGKIADSTAELGWE